MMGIETTTSKSFLVVVIIVLVSTVVLIAQGMLPNYYQLKPITSSTTHSTTTTMQSTTTKSSSLLLDSETNSNNIIYGHLHFPKTGGSNLNGRMAATYDNVCGNKGYSYDAYQFNSRGRHNNITIPGHNIDSISEVSKNNKKYNNNNNNNGKGKYDRGKVPKGIMNEIGYEDCNYISQEKEWEFWPKLINNLNQENENNNNNNNSTLTLELHVPCREPIQHLMSMASHFNKKYECDENETKITIQKAIDNVYMKRLGDKRFSNKFTNNNIELKCFTPFPLENYIHYMQDKLHSRRFPVPYYQPRTTNKKHDKSKECIWDSTSDEYKQKVTQLLIEKHPYMKFCNECIGSSNELQL